MSQYLAQLFAQISRVGRLGRWYDAEAYRTELDLGTLYVLVTRAHADIRDPARQWNWTVYEETGPHHGPANWAVFDSTAPQRFSAMDSGAAPSRSSRSRGAALARAPSSPRLRWATCMGCPGNSRAIWRASTAARPSRPTALRVRVVAVRLDAEMDGRSLP